MIQRLPTRGWVAGGVAVAVALLAFAFTAADAQDETIEIYKSASASNSGTPDPIFIAIVGTDDRPGVSGARADAIHVVGVNQALGKATIINIPRDTHVEIPGHGRRKINESHTLGKAALVSETLTTLTGAPIHFVITTNFEGFTNIVNDVGGVAIDVPYGIEDAAYSGASVGAGPNHMSGEAALAYARARHGTPHGDFSRTSNQGLLLVSALAQVRGNPHGPLDLSKQVAILLRHLKTTNGVTTADLYSLARIGVTIPHEEVDSITMPGASGSAGGASVVIPSAEAGPMFADFADDGVVQNPPPTDSAGNTFP